MSASDATTTLSSSSVVDLPEIDDTNPNCLKHDIPIEDVPVTYTRWLQVTRDGTVGSRNLQLGPRWAFDTIVLDFFNAWKRVEAKLTGKPVPEKQKYAMFLPLPEDNERLELEKHPKYLPYMRKLLGPRLFDGDDEAITYAEVLDRAKLFAEREQISRWQSGYEMKRWYYGESGGRVIMHTEYYIKSFVDYVSYATSHALLSAERIKQAERDAALALRNLDRIKLPISDEFRTMILNPSLLLTRGCFLGHPKVDTPRYAMFNIGSYPAPRNYKPTKQDEQDARDAYIAGLQPEELRVEVQKLFDQSKAAEVKRDEEWEKKKAEWEREREKSTKRKREEDDVESNPYAELLLETLV